MKSDSPFFTPAPSIPGQEEIPLGTVHMCRQCRSDYICDVAECHIDRITDGCESPCCSTRFTIHSKDRRNIECPHCYEFGCARKHKVCAACKGVDGQHYNCPTQSGYQYSLLTS